MKTPDEALAEFEKDPTRKEKGHPVYSESFFSLRTMPESANSEQLLGSLQRRLGLAAVSEREVGPCGTEFLRRLEHQKTTPDGAQLDAGTLRRVLLEHLDSPASHNQKSQRALSVALLVPEFANYTAAVRLKGSPWNPGQLAAEAIAMGSGDGPDAERTWRTLFDALRLTALDDVWARFVQQEVAAWHLPRLGERARKAAQRSSPAGLLRHEEEPLPTLGGDPVLRTPGRQFVGDLRSLAKLPHMLTRREWLAYLESLLRLGLVTHSQWLCHVHIVVWQEIESAFGGTWTSEGLEERLRTALRRPLWSIGEPYVARCTDLARQYLRARYGLNLVLFTMDADPGRSTAGHLQAPSSFVELISLIRTIAAWTVGYQARAEILTRRADLLDRDPQLANCRSRQTNNLREFWLYALAKRQVRAVADAEYDQGAWCQKRAPSPSSPWIVLPGPLALCLAAHCCAAQRRVGATVQDLQDYLLNYGVGSRQADFVRGPLADRMRGLGIVVDSPDAEGGMGILDPLREA